jgi:hypothetical protein
VTLFDEFERTDPSPAGYEEDWFSFLNRVDQQFWQRIRDELERWYADYPDEEHGFGLRARFRRPEAAQHFGAWWELYLHRLFRCLGFHVEVEPNVAGGRPDFRMTRDSDSFVVEATTSFSGIVDEERHPEREAAILAAIDKAQNRTFLSAQTSRRSVKSGQRCARSLGRSNAGLMRSTPTMYSDAGTSMRRNFVWMCGTGSWCSPPLRSSLRPGAGRTIAYSEWDLAWWGASMTATNLRRRSRGRAASTSPRSPSFWLCCSCRTAPWITKTSKPRCLARSRIQSTRTSRV